LPSESVPTRATANFESGQVNTLEMYEKAQPLRVVNVDTHNTELSSSERNCT
jgi:hypothetical protein